MPLREGRIHRYVNAFCPLCHEEQPDRPLAEVPRLSGWLSIHGDRVWLERGCQVHGLVRTLYDESPEILAYLEQWTAPTKVHTPDRTGNFKPVPAAYEDGLPEMQSQHTCILLADLLDHCNLKCPTCFAESSPALASVAPLDQVLASIDARLARENGRIDVLMLSGGEPTLYPHLAELLDEVTRRPVVRILLNTNGLLIARDDALLDLLTQHRERLEVYLQYDGHSAEASTHHRGADIRRFKDDAVDRLSSRGIFTTLTMTAALGVNDDEIGFVLKRALDTPYVGGVTVQPSSAAGAAPASTRSTGSPHGGARPARRADRGLGDLARPHGAAVQPPALLLGRLPAQGRRRTWRSLVSLIGHDRLKQWLDLEPELLANRIADDTIPAAMRTIVKDSLLDLLSEQSSLSHPSMASIWRDICEHCDIGIGTLATLAASRLPGQHQRLRRLLGERVLGSPSSRSWT